MTSSDIAIRCAIKEYRRRKGLSQDELARLVGIRRQAIYDMESGRYLPNTAVALRLARVLNCTVEMLFMEDIPANPASVHLLNQSGVGTRLTLAQVRGKLVGVPLHDGQIAPFKVDASDAFLLEDRAIDCYIPQHQLEKTVLILGCDPAFSVLGTLMNRMAPGIHAHAVFASSKQALRSVHEGNAHIAGIHYHNFDDSDGNIEAVHSLSSGTHYQMITFAEQEEGIMVAPGNPLNIRTVEDLATSRTRFVNREEGAALRKLLDTNLAQRGIPHSMVQGYAEEVYSHSEGAIRVASGISDAALGLRIVAESFGLSFVPLAVTRSDLVIPQDLLVHPGITVLLDVLQSAGIRKELDALPGYSSSITGTIISG